MTKLIIAIVVIAVLAIVIRLLELFVRTRKPHFEYRQKNCVMTNAERDCYRALVAEMGPEYDFFPQVHLDALVQPIDHRSRFYAFRHINQKSVDFVACDKKQLRPLFVIELDDKTHQYPKRVERDNEVERILQGAGLPLIRVENRIRFDQKELARLVQEGIKSFAVLS
jgi:very-short-patch-repair endonuclease